MKFINDSAIAQTMKCFSTKQSMLLKNIFALSVIFILHSTVFATNYYVSSSTGNDGYNGLAGTYNGTNGPWSSLAKVSSITFSAGDQIFLKTGDTWVNQTLQLKGLGTSANPILLSGYGTGAKPKISPQITDAYAITITNTAGWRIVGLEIEKARVGIGLQYDNTYNNDYIFIDNCSIHDIDDTYNSTPNLYNHISSGIVFEGNGTTSAYHLTNITVQDIAFNNTNCAWWVGCISTNTNSSGFGSNSRFRYITVNNLTATNCKQWGYSFLFMEDATITNADCNNTGFGTNPYGACGMLVANAKRVVLDGCDAYHSHRGPQMYDGCGFDFEGGTNTSDVTYKNAIVDHSDGCGIFVFNNNGVGGTPNILIQNVTVSNFGENPGNTSAGIDFSSPGNSSGTVVNCTFNKTIPGTTFYTGYPTAPANFTFIGNTFNDASESGLNIAADATVTASTTDTGNGYSPTKTVDGNTGDFSGWSSLVGTPQWLQFTWPVAQSISKVALYTTAGYYLKDYDVQYWSGTAWLTVSAVRNNVQKQTLSLFTPVLTTKLRIYCITPDQTSYCRIDEVKIYATNIAPNATATASTTDTGNGYAAAKAIDSNTAEFTGWSSLVGAPQWLELTWPSAQSFNKIILYTTTPLPLKDYDVQYWNGSAWLTVSAIRNNNQKMVISAFPGVSTTKLRIYCITADQTSYCRIDELEVYNINSSTMPFIFNGGFEKPATSTYLYGPFTNGWTFDAESGVQRNGSAWGAATAPDGVQTCFLQKSGSVSQIVNFPVADSFRVNFRAAKRSTGGQQSFNVYYDATIIGTYSPSSTSFVKFRTNQFGATAGNHTIKFQGLTTGGDNTDFIDSVFIQKSVSGAFSSLNKNAIGDAVNDNGSQLYPNPAKDFINLQFNSTVSENVMFTVFNSMGQQMQLVKMITVKGKNMKQLIVSGYPAGLYYVVMKGKNGFTSKFIIK